MTRQVPQYEFYSPEPTFRPTSQLTRLEALAEELRASCTAPAIYGMHEYRLTPGPNGTVLDQDYPDDADFVEGVLESAGIENPGSIEAISALVITDSDRYSTYLRNQQGTPSGNWHADWRAVEADGKTLFYPPRAGRLAIALFDDGVMGLHGTIQAPESRVTHYVCPSIYRRTSNLFDEMKNRRQIMVGEEGHFLRGPVSEEPMQGEYTVEQMQAEQWRYWHPNFVHRGAPVEQPGRVQIFVDYRPGHDPVLVNA